MAEADPAQPREINQVGYSLAHLGEHCLQASVKEQGLVVFDQEMVELQVNLRSIDRDSKDVWCNFSNDCHRWTPLSLTEEFVQLWQISGSDVSTGLPDGTNRVNNSQL